MPNRPQDQERPDEPRRAAPNRPDERREGDERINNPNREDRDDDRRRQRQN